jgi:type VI secretion system protein ImpK
MVRTVFGSDEERDLTTLCSDFLMLVMQLRVVKQLDDAERLRSRTKDMLSRLDTKARAAGIEFELVEQAKFALVAFLDEAITEISFDQKDAWLSNPLQMELFNRYDAGEEFFKRLQQLRQRAQANIPALEVYYLCLVAGFKGKYQFQDVEGLRGLIEDTRADLFRFKEGRVPNVLSPHGKPAEGVLEVVSKEVPVWVIGVVAAAVGVLFFVVMSLLINGNADNAVAVIRQAFPS